MSCSSGCLTQDHESYGQCMKAKNLRVAYCNSASGHDATTQKNWDKELDAYASARSQGIQPDGTSLSQVRKAVDISNQTGTAYQGA